MSDLDTMLGQWHRWSDGWSAVAQSSSCAMFKSAKTSKQWDSANDILDTLCDQAHMECIEKRVNEMSQLHRVAIRIHARNLATGFTVWRSAVLPSDAQARALLLRDAKNILEMGLQKDGVMC